MTPLPKTDDFTGSSIESFPESWKIAKLKDVAQITMGQSPPSDTYNANAIGLPFLQGKAEFQSTFPKPIKWCSRPQRTASTGSVLISVRAPVGDVNIAQHEYCIGRGLAAIYGKEFVDNWFLFYQLIYSKERIKERGSGSIFQSINKNTLFEIPFLLPPLAEQRAIARVLTTVRQAIEATERVIEATRQLKKAMMKHLFTYGPVPVHAVDGVQLKETEIGWVPEGWEVKELQKFAKTTSGGTPSRDHPEYYNGDISWVKSGELGDSIISNTTEKISQNGLNSSNAKIFPVGTLLIALYGATAGKVGILAIEAATNQAVCAVFPNQFVLPRFLFDAFIYRRKDLLDERYGGAQPNISQRTLSGFKLPLPSLEEQQVIINIMTSLDKKLAVETQRKKICENIFQSLLTNLMTGKIRVNTPEFVPDSEKI